MNTLKLIHLTAVSLSFIGFLIRYIWMIQASAILQSRTVKVLPHIIDTILLISAIGLTIQIQQYPFIHDWLTAKVLLLCLYIIFGTLALKRGKSKQQRILAGITAIGCYLLIISVAFTHSPFIFR